MWNYNKKYIILRLKMKKEGCQGPLTRESAEERINKGKNALQAPIRETINEDEFIQILEIVKHSSFVGARKKCAMIILAFTLYQKYTT